MSTIRVKIVQDPATPDFFTPYVGWVLLLLEVNEQNEFAVVVQVPHSDSSPKRMAYTPFEVLPTDEPLTWPREDANYEQHGF